MHGSTMIYLFVTPMAIAMAMYLVPLQIGAARLARRGCALAGFWIWLCGGLVMQSGWFDLRWRRPRRLDVVRAAVERHQHAGGRAGPVDDRGDSGRRGDDR